MSDCDCIKLSVMTGWNPWLDFASLGNLNVWKEICA